MPFAIAAGHQATLESAKEILENGGNAVDAAVSAFFTSMISETCMASPGGGGLALVRTKEGSVYGFDFFSQTPKQKVSKKAEHFYPITVDFGSTKEDFYIGAGAMATPGSIAGVYALHDKFGSMPIKELVSYARNLSKNGVVIDSFQAYDMGLLHEILGSTRRGREIYFSKDNILKGEGDKIKMEYLADFIDVLSHEGRDFFYKGDIAQIIDKISKERGGHLRLKDFEQYKVVTRKIVGIPWAHGVINTIGFPSYGSPILMAMLKKLELDESPPFSSKHFDAIVEALGSVIGMTSNKNKLFAYVNEQYNINLLKEGSLKKGGTTHFSISDDDGMAVSLTSTIGEGCGIFIPGTDIHMNNMLGEEALMENGFYNWKSDERMMSMMTPTIIENDNQLLVTGSGGAGRIPYMIAILINYVFQKKISLGEATVAPRIYLNGGSIHVEPGFETSENNLFDLNQWDNPSLYFGGTHSILMHCSSVEACGDERRDGVSYVS